MSLTQKLQAQLEELSQRVARQMYVLDADGYVLASTAVELPQAGDLYPLENEWTADTLWDGDKSHVYARFIDQQGSRMYLCICAQQPGDVHLAYLSARILKAELPQRTAGPDREQQLRELLIGRLTPAETAQLSKEYHLPLQQTRCVILLQAKPEHIEAAAAMMLQAAAARRDDWIVPISPRLVALVRVMRPDEERQELIQLAHALIDTLENEYQLPAKAFIGLPKQQLTQLALSFAEAQQAGKIGTQLHPAEPVYPYNSYLLECFLEQLPPAELNQFYEQSQGHLIQDLLTPELQTMIRTLFTCNLNISEAARTLGVHRNTLLYRLDKIQRATGLDLRNFDNAVVFKLLMQLALHLQSIR